MTPTEMHIDALMEKIEKLESENARYRKALRYYANFKKWEAVLVYDKNGEYLLASLLGLIHKSDLEEDVDGILGGGKRAREALKGE